MYSINRRDEIVFANDEYLRFSFADGAARYKPENVLNKRLWDFIADGLTRKLYETVLRRARLGDTISLSFRCDSAVCRQLFELSVSGLSNGDVLFEFKALCRHKAEKQPPLNLQSASGGEEFLRICGWCKRLDIGVPNWHELENAMTKLSMFETERLPQLTHGICRLCYEAMTEKLVHKRQPEPREQN